MTNLAGTSIFGKLGARAGSVGIAVGVVTDKAFVAFGCAFVVAGEVARMAGSTERSSSGGVAVGKVEDEGDGKEYVKLDQGAEMA